MNPKLFPENHGNLHQKKPFNKLLPIDIHKSKAILSRAVPAQQTFLCALQANLQQMPSHRHHRSWQANRLIWLVWNVMKPSENLGWLVWNVMKPSENLGPQITKSSMVGIPWYSISIPWYPILLSFKMQLPDGRLLPRKAQHLRVCRSWRRLSHEGPHQENHQVGPNCLSLSLGRGSTSTYFNTEHSSWFDCFLAKCRTRQCPWTAICRRSMGWPLEHPNYATLHNEQLVWGITTSKSSRQLNLSGEIVEFQASWAEITLAAVLWCDQNRF